MIADGLIVCSLEPWDDVWRRNQFLVAELLAADRELRVLFVEPPADPTYELSRRRRPRRARGLRQRTDVANGRLWTYQPVKIGPRQLGPVVDAVLTRGVLRAARRIGVHEPVLWINDPAGAPLVTMTNRPALYDITDDWLVADRSPRERSKISANEDILMQRCAAVVVCSPSLQAAKGQRRAVELIPNAVDLPRYQQPQHRPSDLPSGPIALYVGTLHEDRLDVRLCIEVARALSGQAELVFVGPNALTTVNTDLLAGRSNVTLLGSRPNVAIPGYLQHADVLLVPHVVTAFTESLDPIKLYEYLAVGKPVVATPVAGFRTAGPPVVAVASDRYPMAVAAALETSSGTAARNPPAQLPSWTDRAGDMRAIIERIASERPQPRRRA